MPRGIKKQINFDEECLEIDKKIAYHNNIVKQLKEKKANLLQQQQKDSMKSIFKLMKDLELSSNDVIEILKSQKIKRVS